MMIGWMKMTRRMRINNQTIEIYLYHRNQHTTYHPADSSMHPHPHPPTVLVAVAFFVVDMERRRLTDRNKEKDNKEEQMQKMEFSI